MEILKNPQKQTNATCYFKPHAWVLSDTFALKDNIGFLFSEILGSTWDHTTLRTIQLAWNHLSHVS